VQATAEGAPFSSSQLAKMIELARGGVAQLVAAQKTALGFV
jgi:ribonuclease PH